MVQRLLGGMIVRPYRKRLRPKAPPWFRTPGVLEPAFEAVRVHEARSPHWFSTCLYKEPTFSQFFPERDFLERYIQCQARTRERLSEHPVTVKIFVDEEMLPTALELEFADVYLVREPRRFPFSQHVWRYYAALLPGAQSIHFRGLDNVMSKDQELIDRFLASGADVMHAPYMATVGQLMPVRGSCSVANAGIASLAHYLRSFEPQEPGDLWKRAVFHNDEIFLRDWYRRDSDFLGLYTVIDRKLPPVFFTRFQRRILRGLQTFMECRFTGRDGPLRSPPVTGLAPSSGPLQAPL